MAKTTRVWTLEQIASAIGGTFQGPADRIITRPVPAGSQDPEGITFAESEEYLAKVLSTGVGAVIVPRSAPAYDVATIHVDHPRAAFGMVLGIFQRPLPLAPGVHPSAVISPEAFIHETASVGPYVVVEAGASIGAGSKIYPFAYIGEGCQLGENVTIFPQAVLYQDVRIGDRSIVHSGSVIGADGFGFVWNGKDRSRRIKVPQVGNVEIGSDVEIGALSAIDRATAGSTIVSHGVKLDNFVQVGHNCVIGEHTVIAGQTAMGGSSSLGRANDVGGQSAISDHVSVGDNIILAGRTGVTNTISDPGAYWGTPARPIGIAKRIKAVMQKLPELSRTVKELERRIAELEGKNS